jgi:hypothetical protein
MDSYSTTIKHGQAKRDVASELRRFVRKVAPTKLQREAAKARAATERFVVSDDHAGSPSPKQPISSVYIDRASDGGGR